MNTRQRNPKMLVTAEVILTLQAVQPVSRDELEEATLHVEEVFAEHLADLTGGASASANFETCSIEIDLALSGPSRADIHQQTAQVIAALDEHSALRLRPEAQPRSAPQNALALTASATQFVPQLVPA
jgi:hypothetical protein